MGDYRGLCFINLPTAPPQDMRTYAYIDGFNLYFGALKGTSHKWLDVKLLLRTVLGNDHHIQKIKYYTARISARPDNPNSPLRQMVYLNAIRAYIPELEIHFGYYLSNVVRMRLAKPTPSKKFEDVIKTEEKGSDVNLALHVLNDAWHDRYDCAVIISNDSDLSEALRLIKKQHKKKIVLLVPGDPSLRPPAIQLKRFAHKTISIPLTAISKSQLPDHIPNTTIHKPAEWR
ncbi:MAG: hypothetical protein OJF50_006601 [Nitrospira sp.]|jgi:uncharacterized LabA/DUF88 family protein|nr:hypothetical protein [Nitrospira sp.]